MPDDWVHEHQPVISRHSTGHQLYSKFSVERPRGMVVLCHRVECKQVLKFRINGIWVDMTCPGCKSTCRMRKHVTDDKTPLGKASIVRVQYPPPQFPTEWWLPKDGPIAELLNAAAVRPQTSTRRPKNAQANLLPLLANLPPPLAHPPPPQLIHSVSSRTSTPAVGVSSSSSTTIIIPPRNSQLARSRSAPAIRSISATPTPPPQSPHEPSPTPSEGKRQLVDGTRPRGQKKRKKTADQ